MDGVVGSELFNLGVVLFGVESGGVGEDGGGRRKKEVSASVISRPCVAGCCKDRAGNTTLMTHDRSLKIHEIAVA